MKEKQNKYGHFSAHSDEFIITTPDIPRNWYNYFYTDPTSPLHPRPEKVSLFCRTNWGAGFSA